MNQQYQIDFSGKTYVPERDKKRLGKQLEAVAELMKDGQWRTLAEIAEATGAPEASVSARCRDLRNKLFWKVERKFISRGLHKYRCEPCA